MDLSSECPAYFAADEMIGGDSSKLKHWLVGLAVALFGFCLTAVSAVSAAPALVIELSSGAVLYEDQAAQPWYPASLTKLMTVYVALKAVRDHNIALNTPLVISARAASMPPSKMGFRPGTLVTLEAALKMLMVKSANDIAITVAEGVSGSVEAFADDMNESAASLGMLQSHFVNPNGLPNPQHVSSARDLAILARALYLTFPEQAELFNIGALEVEGKVITNHNNLLGRYPGIDGMKTGFTCAAGFNVVASANQGGKRLIAIILGSPNVALRTIRAAALFDRGFAGIDRPSGSVADLPARGATPPDMQNSICRNRGGAIAEANADIERLMAPLEAANAKAFAAPERAAYDNSALSRISPMATRIALVPAPDFEPMPISIGAPAGYVGPIARPRAAHSALGADAPPEALTAYAPLKQPAFADGGAPLAQDVGALPMRGRQRLAHQSRTKIAHGHRLAATQTVAIESSGKKVKASGKHVHVAKVKSPEAKSAGAKVKPDKVKPDKVEIAKAKIEPHAHRQPLAKAGKAHGGTATVAQKAGAKKVETNAVQ
jgi:D-alanyl-D-alanine carboxypeptidase